MRKPCVVPVSRYEKLFSVQTGNKQFVWWSNLRVVFLCKRTIIELILPGRALPVTVNSWSEEERKISVWFWVNTSGSFAHSWKWASTSTTNITGHFVLFCCPHLLSSSICYKMVSADPLEVHPHNAHWFLHQQYVMCIIFCLAKQMPVSLNIFICIHVSISKGMEVNPPPQGEAVSQCFSAAATVGVEQKTSRSPHRQFIPLGTRIFLEQLSVKYKVPELCQKEWLKILKKTPQ